jgi:NAD(P)-dependent dehydrogenase (short-subunit alcohol dehydrogenase family)
MLERKVAMVTGAGRGIGREISLRLAREGYSLGLLARTRSQIEETAAMVRQYHVEALPVPTDVSIRDQVVSAANAIERELGPVSVLINNAGAYLRKRFTDVSESEFDFQLKVNTYGPFFCSQAVVDGMAERGCGTILFVLGSESRLGPSMFAAYNASKVAQRAIAESLAHEYMHRGVHVAALDVDGPVDSARVREAAPGVDPSHFVSPTRITEEIVRLIEQPRDAWTFIADLRSFAQWRPRSTLKKS